MERWRGKVAVVTGASAGIGLAIAKRLLREGLIVVGLARRKEKMLNEMKNVVESGQFFPVECDVSRESDVDAAFDFVKASFKTVHVLVNNAGIFKKKSVEEADMKELQEVINVNLVGLLHCTKKAIKLMRENDHEAHIININSTAGHRVPNVTLPNGMKIEMNVYSPTKFAVTSLSEVLTNELINSQIRVTSLSPGFVKTEIGANEAEIEKILQGMTSAPHLKPDDIADAVAYVVGAPRHVLITELTMKPLGEFF